MAGRPVEGVDGFELGDSLCRPGDRWDPGPDGVAEGFELERVGGPAIGHFFAPGLAGYDDHARSALRVVRPGRSEETPLADDFEV